MKNGKETIVTQSLFYAQTAIVPREKFFAPRENVIAPRENAIVSVKRAFLLGYRQLLYNKPSLICRNQTAGHLPLARHRIAIAV